MEDVHTMKNLRIPSLFIIRMKMIEVPHTSRKAGEEPLKNGTNNEPINEKIEHWVNKWERIVHRVPFSDKYLIDEYWNDLDVRYLIDQNNAKVSESSMKKVEACDEIFRSKTIQVSFCVRNKIAEKMDNLNPNTHWYYYRIPPSRKDWIEWMLKE